MLATDYRTRYRVEFYDGKFDQMPLLANVSFNRTLESFSSYSNDLLVRLCHSCDDPRNRACWNQTDQIQLYVVTDNGKLLLKTLIKNLSYLFDFYIQVVMLIFTFGIVEYQITP